MIGCVINIGKCMIACGINEGKCTIVCGINERVYNWLWY